MNFLMKLGHPKGILRPGLLLAVLATHAVASEFTHHSLPFKQTLPGVEGEIRVKIDIKAKDFKLTRDFYGSQINDFSTLVSVPLMRNLAPGRIRVGGNIRDVFNWENGLVLESSTRTYAKIRTFEELDPYFKKFEAKGVYQVNMMGWQPELVNNSYQIVESANAKHAGNLIRHLNGKLKLKIENFSLSNEFEQWAEIHSTVWKKPEPLTADEYIDRYVKFVLEMRAAQEEVSGNPNDIKIWGPEIANSWYEWQSANMEKDCEWHWTVPGAFKCNYGGEKFTHFIPYFLSRLAEIEKDTQLNPKGYKLLDVFAFHYYPNFRTSMADLNSIILDAAGKQNVPLMLGATQVFHNESYKNVVDKAAPKILPSNFLGQMKEWIKANYPKVELALNEFAIDSIDGSFGYHEIVRPLYTADLVGILANNKIFHFNLFSLNAITPNITPWDLVRDDRPTSMFHMYSLFTNNFLGNVLPVEDQFGDSINGYATYFSKMGADGDIHLFLINKDAWARKVKVVFEKGQGPGTEILDYEMPAWSTSFLKIPSRLNPRSKIKVEQYGAKEMNVKIDPHYVRGH